MGMGDGRTDVWELWRTPAWHRGRPGLDAFVMWLCEDEHEGVKVKSRRYLWRGQDGRTWWMDASEIEWWSP